MKNIGGAGKGESAKALELKSVHFVDFADNRAGRNARDKLTIKAGGETITVYVQHLSGQQGRKRQLRYSALDAAGNALQIAHARIN